MKRLGLYFLFLLLLTACGEEQPTFSLLPDSDTFYQNPSQINNKLDILWVIDNSGSMQEEQQNLADNFNAFISEFVTKGYDYQIAVGATDGWRALFGFPNKAQFKDGSGSNHSGVFLITPDTPNVIQTFITNVKVGINGSGDERAFQSFREILESPFNEQYGIFPREDGFLAIIIVSDEDDFSHNGSYDLGHNYNDPNLHTVQSYVDYLDTLTQSTGSLRRYSVSTIAVTTPECRDAIGYGVLGQRYMDLANATDGVIGDICSTSFADDLAAISNHIAELSTQFYLSREPIPETIRVYVNGTLVPEDPVNGWTYNPAAISIIFHGSAIPPQGASIHVDFDPVTIIGG